jgi:hypothetical protein
MSTPYLSVTIYNKKAGHYIVYRTLGLQNQRKVAVSFRKYVKIHKKIRATYIRERPFNF